MRITKQQEELMRSMCMERKSNKEIAEAVGIHVTQVHAWRSRNNLTRVKVEKILSEQQCQRLSEYCNTVNHDSDLRSILDSCEWSLDKVVALILTALESDDTCSYCSHKNDKGECLGELTSCTTATVAHIRAKVGEKS